MRLSLLILLLLSAQVALAQDEAPPPSLTAPPLLEADAKPKPRRGAPKGDYPLVLDQGESVAVQVPDGRRYAGELLRLMPGELTLQLRTKQEVSILLTDVQKLEVQRRTWWQGALIGGAIGGAIGGLGGGFICLLNSTVGPVNVGECTGAAVLLVGAIGAGVGLVVGLTGTSWSTVYDREKDGNLLLSMEPGNVVQRWASNAGHRGELGLVLGYAQGLSAGSAGGAPGGRVHALLLLGPHFALGGELALYPYMGDRHLVQLGGLARAGIQTGPARTSLLVGVGIVEHQRYSTGGSVGLEVEMTPWKDGPPVALDVSYLTQFESSFGFPRQDFLTFNLGSRVRF